ATKITKRGTKMANFMLEDTTGHMECICFKYDECSDQLVEDAIVKIKGKFEVTDRGSQLLAFEVKALELAGSEADAKPALLELRIKAGDFGASTTQRLNRILMSHPGRDGVVLLVQQADGRKFRAELPMTVDSSSPMLLSEIGDLLGRSA
ncbi:MAG: OB-fold nucleic acid binding domain-containing protein, partial [Raoultibacter sp.]